MTVPTILALAFLFAAFAPFRACAQADYREIIGYNALRARLGRSMPDGRRVEIAQIEASESGAQHAYRPAPGDEYAGTIVDATAHETGNASYSSGHALGVARQIYAGDRAMAPAVPRVYVYQTGHYVNRGLIAPPQVNGSAGETAPGLRVKGSVHTHSWIGGDPKNPASSANLLRHLDYAIDTAQVVDAGDHPVQRGFVAVVGVNNGDTPIPPLLGSAYNVIAVGLSDGQSSHGPTIVDLPGRSKPDIVAPGAQVGTVSPRTSRATPRVAAAAALLLDSAHRREWTAALRPEVIKALLLTGASKTPLPSWSHTPTGPLDLQFGAGVLDVNCSHWILEAGPQLPTSEEPLASTGWHLGSMAGGTTQNYHFRVPRGDARHGLSATLTWHRRVDLVSLGPGGEKWLRALVPNLDLKLFRSDPQGKKVELAATSESTLDNVEHLHLRQLPAEWYVLEVTALGNHALLPEQQATYALAWRTSLPPPARSWLGMVVVGLVLLLAGALLYFVFRLMRRRRQPAG